MTLISLSVKYDLFYQKNVFSVRKMIFPKKNEMTLISLSLKYDPQKRISVRKMIFSLKVKAGAVFLEFADAYLSTVFL